MVRHFTWECQTCWSVVIHNNATCNDPLLFRTFAWKLAFPLPLFFNFPISHRMISFLPSFLSLSISIHLPTTTIKTFSKVSRQLTRWRIVRSFNSRSNTTRNSSSDYYYYYIFNSSEVWQEEKKRERKKGNSFVNPQSQPIHIKTPTINSWRDWTKEAERRKKGITRESKYGFS